MHQADARSKLATIRGIEERMFDVPKRQQDPPRPCPLFIVSSLNFVLSILVASTCAILDVVRWSVGLLLHERVSK